MPDKKLRETADRDAKGRFLPGNRLSTGRPKGATCHALRQAREAAEKYALPLLIQAVQEGDIKAATALVAYGLPKHKPMVEVGPVTFREGATLTEKAEAVLQSVADGTISGDAGKVYMDMLSAVATMKQADELEARVAILEHQLAGGGNNGATGEAD
ncbi:hypothetical protein [Mailhella sp.]|uniref:hypothetical protein n=1 Tax=Mailhella sp. TaxID=1981029 RepID=UPI0040629E90